MKRDLVRRSEQTIWVTIGGNSLEFRFFEFKGFLYADVKAGDSGVVTGKRVIPNRWILPEYLSNIYGNARFETYDSDRDEYVDYRQFNDKFRLNIYTATEMESM